MTPLGEILIKHIRTQGPISLAHYMAECLGHPEHGYYMSAEPFGIQGDFTTAPEISQMFGELLGLWIGDLWTRQGKPIGARLVELGPGRGTLMADVRRALKKVPGWAGDASVHFVETSPRLERLQHEKHPDGYWHKDVADVPAAGPLYILANELFDALPIRQFEKQDAGWAERFVCLTKEAGFALSALPGSADMSAMIPESLKNVPVGSVAETCAPGQAVAQTLSQRVATQGGAALIIDYGYTTHQCGDSFQALARHEYTDPFKAPGHADLTAHVNFQMLKDSANCAVYGPVPQGEFLNALGLKMRAQQLGQEALIAAKRLAEPDQMGTLFKCLAYVPHTSPQPAGF